MGDLIVCLAGGDGAWGVTALSTELGFPKAVVHRMLQSLVSRGLVRRRADGRYAVGPSIEEVAAESWQSQRLIAAADAPLYALRTRVRETVVVSGVQGYKRVGLLQFLGLRETSVAMRLDRRPLTTGATGHVILAHADAEFRQLVYSWEARHGNAATEAAPARWAEIRANGFAISESSGGGEIGAVAAPVTDRAAGVVGAIAVLAPVHRIDSTYLRGMAPDVVAAAQATSVAWNESRSDGAGEH
ncbi:hypothetical protein ASJ79_12770 [Mycobacterium sp. NAZ190054]|nr:hypothetical protein ASJ79_12770 [Mycobacterium sp. NAZ190054]